MKRLGNTVSSLDRPSSRMSSHLRSARSRNQQNCNHETNFRKTIYSRHFSLTFIHSKSDCSCSRCGRWKTLGKWRHRTSTNGHTICIFALSEHFVQRSTFHSIFTRFAKMVTWFICSRVTALQKWWQTVNFLSEGSSFECTAYFNDTNPATDQKHCSTKFGMQLRVALQLTFIKFGILHKFTKIS